MCKTTTNTFVQELFKFLDEIKVSTYLKDANGKYLACNQYMLDIIGLKNRNEIIGKSDHDLVWKNIANNLEKIDKLVLADGVKHEVEETPLINNGDQRVFLSTKVALHYFDEKVLFGISMDITDRKRAEELRIKQETAEKVIDFTKLMAGSMAHEILTPLTIIGSRIDLLKAIFQSLDPNEEVKEIFLKEHKIIKKIIYAGDNTVKDMLLKLRGFATGKLPEVNYRKLSISNDIREFLLTFPFQEGERELIGFNSGYEFFYLGDEILTNHLIGNLVKNALHAIKSNAGKGGITIELKANEKFNQLVVRDTATGIPKKYLAKIFDQYETKKTTSGGTGLGLAFCKMVMESYGGSITCNSELGKYTEFVLSFPEIKNSAE